MKKLILVAAVVVFLAMTVFGMGRAEKTAGIPAAEQATVDNPVQNRAVVGAETIRTDFLDVVCRYETGTAGSSLKRAVAAMHVLDFCHTQQLTDTDKDKFTENLLVAWGELPENEKELFPELFASVSEQVDEDLQNGASLSGLFDDAGILESMQQLLAQDGLQASWEVLKECAKELK